MTASGNTQTGTGVLPFQTTGTNTDTDTHTNTDSNADTDTNTGGLFYAQTTMPTTTGPTATDTDTATGGTQPTGTSTSTGDCPMTSSAPKCYQLNSDFPPVSQWMSIQCLINHSRPDMVGSSNDGPNEADLAIAAVQSQASIAGIDPRIPFAVMMQESSGKVRPIVGDYGLSYGLFQTQIDGVPLCDNYTKNECPESVITAQVQFGIFGHSGTGSPVAPGIAYWLSTEGGDVGRALRGYNTGSVTDPNDLTNVVGGTASYVSDVANRLVGGLLGAQHQYTCA
ncbi:MAG: hypothetical protein Q9222_005036 [Ikaeria aurantiellina]